jgi:Reverse transcriptase (RNA-dependent DNA polymerase)
MKKTEWLSQFSDPLVEAIQNATLSDYTTKSRRRNQDSPWEPIPDVSELKINLREKSELFEMFGLNRRKKPLIEFTNHDNGRKNRYLEHQLLRLNRLRDEGKTETYFKVAEILMKRSNTFRVSAIQHVMKKWYRNFPLKYVLDVNREVSRIINKKKDKMSLRRVYELKPNGSYRPIGAPSYPWRIVLHMMSNFIEQFYHKKWLNSQHGFIPGRGCLTAWKNFFKEKFYLEEEIWEWDIQNFFPSFKYRSLDKEMEKDGIPKGFRLWIENINRSNPKMPSEVLLKSDENFIENRRDHDTDEDWRFSYLDEQTQKKKEAGEWTIEDWLEEELQIKALSPTEKKEEMKRILEEQARLLEAYNPTHISTEFLGVAQGAPTSPTLANIVMKEIMHKLEKNGIRTLSYADDFITNKNIPDTLKEEIRQEYGVAFSAEKCGQIKNGPKWKPLKFLGLVFDGESLMAKTRTGSSLKLIGKIEQLAYIINWLEANEYKQSEDYVPQLALKTNWEELFKSKLIGWIQSRMYIGEWDITEIRQDFTLQFQNQSWTQLNIGSTMKRAKADIDIFNLSSYACESLVNLLRWNSKIRKARGTRFKFILTGGGKEDKGHKTNESDGKSMKVYNKKS